MHAEMAQPRTSDFLEESVFKNITISLKVCRFELSISTHPIRESTINMKIAKSFNVKKGTSCV